MSAITIRNIPDHVHDALRKRAKEEGKSVEALAREALEKLARSGDLFEEAEQARKRLGVSDQDWPQWTDELDEPELSRSVLGLDAKDEGQAPGR
ncbi:MAG: FitA-like ribbon-helix-helix domain-containing protein [Oceanicaulis sp.]